MGYSYKELWKISAPILASMMMENVVGFTDTVFIGRVGEPELAAVGLGWLYFLAVFIIGVGFSMGAQILISRRNGEKNFSQIGPVAFSAGAFLTLAGAALFAFTTLLAPYCFRAAIADDDVFKYAAGYLNWRIAGVFFIYIILVLRAFLVGITNTKALTASSLIIVSLNVALNYALIFGNWGLPKLGVKGAAIASFSAEAAGCAFLILYVFKRIDLKKYGLNNPLGASAKIVLKILSLSIYTMAQYFLSVFTWLIFFLAVGRIGTDELAASNILRNIMGFVQLPIFAFGLTASTVTGNLIGKGGADEVVKNCRKVAKMCFWAVLPIIAIITAFPREFMSIYTNSPHIVDISQNAVYVVILSCLLAAPGNIFYCAVSGSGNTK
ncbi:MAG: MATE family efflux transporter, partial [Opitutales bacterium]|nr:MATE family efflux transporter [Opitutales bacterium]